MGSESKIYIERLFQHFMEIERVLQKSGFTQNEVKVYLTLLQSGKATSYMIVKEATISSGKIYETLDKLVAKGLVSYVIIRGRKYFKASNPERLLDYIKKREQEIHEERREIEHIIPKLRHWRKITEDKTNAELYEGISGIKTVYELMLREAGSGSTILIVGAPKEAGDKLDVYFDNFNRRRIEKNIQLKIILNYGHPREKKLKSIPQTQVKVFQKEIVTPAWITIFDDYVATFNLAEKPIVFLIKDKKIANSYKEYFQLMWKIAKR